MSPPSSCSLATTTSCTCPNSGAGEPAAVIRWRAAVHALDQGLLPCSRTETAVLKIAASIGDDAVGVHLRTLLGGLDHRNIALVTDAITRANG